MLAITMLVFQGAVCCRKHYVGCLCGAGRPEQGAAEGRYPGAASPSPLQTDRHDLPQGYRVRGRPVLGRLHHEYWLEKVGMNAHAILAARRCRTAPMETVGHSARFSGRSRRLRWSEHYQDRNQSSRPGTGWNIRSKVYISFHGLSPVYSTRSQFWLSSAEFTRHSSSNHRILASPKA